VTVVPRPQEPGFPIKLLNYMAAGKASVVFASSASGLPRDAVRLAEPDTAEALAQGILDVLGDESLRRRLEELGHQYVCRHHDRRAVADRLHHTYLRSTGRSHVDCG
jgi:glycosyltransferase involved in cell wall biosynthesis